MRSWSAQSWAHICIMHLAGMRVHYVDHVLVRGIKQRYAVRGGRGVKTTGTLIHAVVYSKYIDLNLECKSQNGR